MQLRSYAASSLNSLFGIRGDAAPHNAASLSAFVFMFPLVQFVLALSSLLHRAAARTLSSARLALNFHTLFVHFVSSRVPNSFLLSSSRAFVHLAKTSNRRAL